MNFQKYSANGNDFIIVESDLGESLNAQQIQRLCHRKNGIGADGLMYASPSDQATFKMNYFNSDGSRGNMCGNGSRALTHYVMTSRQWDIQTGTFIAGDGLHHFRIEDDKKVWVEILSEEGFIDHEIQGYKAKSCVVGVDHLVVPITHLHTIDVDVIGQSLCFDAAFPNQINVNFIEAKNGIYTIRTYERGVYAETDACGTGATASAKFLEHMGDHVWPKQFEFIGGTLSVDKNNGRYWLAGSVNFIFDGTLAKDILADLKQLGNE